MEIIWRILENPEEDLEYVVRVCNHFWPARDKSAPAEESLGGQEIHDAEPDRRQSLVPGTALMPVVRLQPTAHVPVPTVFWQTAVLS